jgi:nucleoside-diphosphate-sugar epimerase
MHILILGGTGSGGQKLIQYLHGANPNVDLTLISRTATELPGVKRMLTGHYGSLIDSSSLRPQLTSLDAVVHLADGLSILQQRRYAADRALADRLLNLSEALALAIRDARVPLFVHVSSIKALCDEEDERVLVETSEPHGSTLYGQSKWRLELRLSEALAASDTRLVIIRNPVMYGGPKVGSIGRLLRLVDTPFPLPFAGLTNKRSLLALDNFASALAAILDASGNRVGGVFHVHDGPALSTTEIVETLRSAMGRHARLFPAGTPTADFVRRLPMIGPVVRRLYGSLELSDAYFRQCFKWAPVIETKVALCRMARSAVR